MVTNTAPVLLIAFNRPDVTERVLEQIKLAKPAKLFVSVDGPRHEKDKKQIDLVKEVVSKLVNWDCELKTLYHQKNLGCMHAVTQAISWFFEHVEAGIILEDDCLPAIDFWEYTANMLEKYKDDTSVGHVSGFSLLEFDSAIPQNHILIRHSQIWGWATWRRVWNLYQLDPLANARYDWGCMAGDFNYKLYFYRNLLLIRKGKIDTWDFQYQYMLYKNNLRTVLPLDNMIQNIGFDERATHTTDSEVFYSKYQAKKLRNHNNVALENLSLSNQSDLKIIGIAFKRNLWVNIIKTIKALLIS